MFEWIANNIATIAVSVVVFGVVAIVVVKMISNRKKGKGSCNCGCACEGCSMNGMCHK